MVLGENRVFKQAGRTNLSLYGLVEALASGPSVAFMFHGNKRMHKLSKLREQPNAPLP